ncbi:MAG TPA: PEP/pyruvate-binding domain-containing protein, partial [Dehalococcoidia bacterium]|nr:PEP/pyruvate-binding domain-containing protein [Dehalococcoidia bacterium]
MVAVSGRYNVKCHSASTRRWHRAPREKETGMVTVDPKASPKYIYRFTEGNAQMRELLGGKGANLAEMASLGLPVPPGFTITS